MLKRLTEAELDALFYDSADALLSCVEQRELDDALTRLSNMRFIVHELRSRWLGTPDENPPHNMDELMSPWDEPFGRVRIAGDEVPAFLREQAS
jgi:hypothetical protein